MVKDQATRKEAVVLYSSGLLKIKKGRKLFAMLLALVLFVNGYGQTFDKASEIDKIFSWATPETPGCACAVSQNGKGGL